MSRADVRRYVVAYDIPNDRRRTQVAKTLGQFGDRVQYSVFVVDASPLKFNRLKRALLGVMDEQQDSLLLCDLGLARAAEDSRFVWLGREREVTSSIDSFVV